MSTNEVVVERDGAVLVIRINRPDKRNAMNQAVMAGIGHALNVATADPAVRAAILTGTGDRSFCAGMDLKGFAQGGDGPPSADAAAGLQTFGRFMRGGADLPVICAAQASALAGGFELLLACDLVVASADASFGLPEVKRGLFAAGGGVFISRRIPLAKALELTLTGDPITAEEAKSAGLVNQVVPAAEVMGAALALAARVAANGPLAVSATLRLVRAAATEPAADVWAMQGPLQAEVFGSEDAKEGALAFVERRTPTWTGR